MPRAPKNPTPPQKVKLALSGKNTNTNKKALQKKKNPKIKVQDV